MEDKNSIIGRKLNSQQLEAEGVYIFDVEDESSAGGGAVVVADDESLIL